MPAIASDHIMKIPRHLSITLLLIAGCGLSDSDPTGGPRSETDKSLSLREARKDFTTRLVRQEKAGQPLPQPPPNVFTIVQFDSPAGKLSAYLTPQPADGQRHPAIIWITGGDCNTIDDAVWQEQPPENEQSAKAFREAGIVQMFPSLRGGNNNPGFKEGFFGEVDDVIAAAEFLASQAYVDPQRIYLGGHSSGGTLALLVAAATDRFRAVFSFGPADDLHKYGLEYHPFDTANPREFELRAPARWLHSMNKPVFVFEGTEAPANVDSLNAIARLSSNPLLHVHPVPGVNHFSILYPMTRLIARKVLIDTGSTSNIAFSESELRKSTGR